MSWESTVKEYFRKQPLQFSVLSEMIEQLAPLNEDAQNQTLEDAIGVVSDHGFEFIVVGNTIKILVPDEEREEVMTKVVQIFEPFGFEYDPLRGAKFGRMLKISRKEGSAFVVVKPKGRTTRAATAGADYEELIVNLINNRYRELGISATTAGFGTGSDLSIQGDKGRVTIELKTSSGADFGQFKLFYSIKNHKWIPAPTSHFKKNEALFSGLFEDFLKDFLNKNAKFFNLNDPRLKITKGFITGLSPHIQTGELKEQLANDWFDGRKDLRVSVDAKSISSYYKDKGDSFIQIGNKGLYSFYPEDNKSLDIPIFGTEIKEASIRFRIKPHSARNGHHSFTVACRVVITPSNKDLNNEEDMDDIINKLI